MYYILTHANLNKLKIKVLGIPHICIKSVNIRIHKI